MIFFKRKIILLDDTHHVKNYHLSCFIEKLWVTFILNYDTIITIPIIQFYFLLDSRYSFSF